MKSRLLAQALLGFAVVTAVLLPTAPVHADQARDLQWHLRSLDLFTAHRHSRGEGVVVAVVDTGVDATHPDLAGAVLPGADLTPNASGDGRTDQAGHGTAMAGLIAARGRSPGNGVLGIAPEARILPVRTRKLGLSIGIADASVRGVEWATVHGAKVLCIAGGGDDDPQVQRAVEAALRADILVVAGVGNRPDNSRVMWPAAYPGVVAAAGVDRDGNHADVSVTGPQVLLAAPAVDIVSTDKGGDYWRGTGTSGATAIIAGAAALVRAKYPKLTASEVVHRLTATATDKGPTGRDDQYGHGVINLVKALTADVPSPTPATSPPATRAAPPTTVAPAPEPAAAIWLIVIGFGVLMATSVVVTIGVLRRRHGHAK